MSVLSQVVDMGKGSGLSIAWVHDGGMWFDGQDGIEELLSELILHIIERKYHLIQRAIGFAYRKMVLSFVRVDGSVWAGKCADVGLTVQQLCEAVWVVNGEKCVSLRNQQSEVVWITKLVRISKDKMISVRMELEKKLVSFKWL